MNLRLALLSGLVLGLHFATWISSLEYTSVVNSVVLVTTNPLWVALLAPIFLGEKLGRWTLIGLGLALAGGVLVALSGESGNPPTRPDHLLGNSLALMGALAAAIYFIIGRKVRGGLAIIPYIWLVYTTAALTLVLVVLASGQQVLGLPLEAYLAMAMLGLFPQLIGHSSFNFALGFLPAAYVSLVVLGEPIGSGILAAIFLDEWPVPLQLLGALLIMTGIAAGTRDQLERKRKQAVEVEMLPDDSEQVGDTGF
jgi:drug/metabolite transporter (DMT)-like permease